MKQSGIFQPPHFARPQSQPKTVRLLWALPVTLFIFVLILWVERGFWNYVADFPQKNIDYFYPGAMRNYLGFGILAVLPILSANWSRRFWPRLALALTLLAVEVSIGSWLILSTRLPAQ